MSNNHAHTADESGTDEHRDPDRGPGGSEEPNADEPELEPLDGAQSETSDDVEARPERDSGTTLTTNELFEALASPGNRYVLTYLLRRDNPAPFGDLVEYVVEQVGPPEGTTPGKFRGRIATRLVHTTLPKLADCGLLEYDTEQQLIRARPAIERAAPYLDLALSQAIDRD